MDQTPSHLDGQMENSRVLFVVQKLVVHTAVQVWRCDIHIHVQALASRLKTRIEALQMNITQAQQQNFEQNQVCFKGAVSQCFAVTSLEEAKASSPAAGGRGSQPMQRILDDRSTPREPHTPSIKDGKSKSKYWKYVLRKTYRIRVYRNQVYLFLLSLSDPAQDLFMAGELKLDEPWLANGEDLYSNSFE